ncbi:MAG: SpoIIE family protein phosphatase [Bacteroidetes bacterium]|nr:SpoIIE family protein phosphatase [Bacteroidota bacterium]
MSYLHTEIIDAYSPKVVGSPSGDSFGAIREEDAVTFILCDGLGSGIKANISATFTMNRVLGMMKTGVSMREAFYYEVTRLNKQWGKGHPFAVFSLARILNNGDVSVLSYDSPPPVLVSTLAAVVLKHRVFTIGKAVIYESNGTIGEGEGILLMSDGITQAGLGNGLINGWEAHGVAKYITSQLMFHGLQHTDVPKVVHRKAREFWGKAHGDDCTAVFALCRRGITVNLITGVPANKQHDKQFVEAFNQMPGIQVVCGGTTSRMVARELKRSLVVTEDEHSTLSPPSYKIEHITLVTEGVITLNQVYNLLGEDTDDLIDESAVYELNALLTNADRIHLWVGSATNPGAGHIQFLQQGILPRKKIVPLIAEKLRSMGKLVVVFEDE